MLLLAVVIVSTVAVQAQKAGFFAGPRFGIGSYTFVDNNFQSVQSKTIFAGGVSASYGFGKLVSLSSDLMVSSRGAKVNDKVTGSGIFAGDQAYEENFKLLYAEIPVLLKLNIGLGGFSVSAFAGPSLNFNLLAKSTRAYSNENYNDNNGYDNRELKLMLGGVFSLDFRINAGLTPLGTVEGRDLNGFGYMVTLGHSF